MAFSRIRNFLIGGRVRLGTIGPLRRVVDALVDNATRHAPRDGSVEVAVATADRRVVLRVADNGPVPPPLQLRDVDHALTIYRLSFVISREE